MGKKRVAKQTDTEMQDVARPAGKASSKKRKKISRLSSSRIYVSASYNNTLVSVTDAAGNVLFWSSAGLMGFRGPKKATAYAASKVVDNVFEKVGNIDLGKVSVYVQGVGSGRDATIRALSGRGVNIVSLKDITPVPHNGCRPKKARRV